MKKNETRSFASIASSALTGRETVITVNERLARWLSLQHNRRQKLAGKVVWDTPPIHSLDTWTRESWLNAWPDKYALSPTQSSKLWEDIIRREHYSGRHDLLHLRGAAQLAGDAYKYFIKYRLPTLASHFDWVEETRSFLRWMKIYERRLQELNAIDSSAILDELRVAQEKDSLPLPDEMVFAGFDDIDPQLRDWLSFLAGRDVRIRFLPENPDQPPESLTKLAAGREVNIRKYADLHEEVAQCARWVRSVHSPDKTIGIVAPQLDKLRPLIKRMFSAELAPASVFPWNEEELPFNISKTPPLRNEPPVHLALLILSAPNGPMPFKIFCAVLGSTFLHGGKTEITGRMALEKKLRRGKAVKIYLNKVYGSLDHETIPHLASITQKWQAFINSSGSRLPSAWAKMIATLLQQIGWPFGGDETNGDLFPILDKWNECLDALASLDQISGKINRMQAVNALDKIAEIPFSKKSPEEPIQIVGLLESSALEFDRLWVMGCSLDNMPAKPSPNPFIPMELQKTHNLPHSTSERELKFSEQILARLMKSAPEIIFSYPAWQGNRETTISPLITALDRHEKAPIIELSHAPALQIANSATLETWEDPAQLPIAQDELAGVKGGQSILADMAKCPFRAFAVHRLHAQQLEEPEIDVDAASRGNTVHKAMELFWNDVRSQEKLINIYDADELPARVRKHVANAMKTQMNSFTHQPRFADLETERITHLILQWLESDLERPPFTVLDAEKNISLNVEGLNLTLQVDRIDKTKEGEIIIVDYKTGQANKNDWFGERLIQPQLPLYNLKTPASAIAFAKINKKQCGYEGVAKKNNIITGLDTDNYKTKTGSSNWEELMEFWRQKIHGLANSFISGQLIVDPADVKKTCEHCGLQSLCRVAEQKTIKAREETDA